MRASLAVLIAASALAACSDGGETTNQAALPVGTQITDNGVVQAPATEGGPTIPTATGPGTAFGLTTEQLEDADLLDGANARLAEVERITTDRQGNVNGVVVEVDADPDRSVALPLQGLEPVAVGEQWHLRAPTLTRERLLAFPEATG